MRRRCGADELQSRPLLHANLTLGCQSYGRTGSALRGPFQRDRATQPITPDTPEKHKHLGNDIGVTTRYRGTLRSNYEKVNNDARGNSGLDVRPCGRIGSIRRSVDIDNRRHISGDSNDATCNGNDANSERLHAHTQPPRHRYRRAHLRALNDTRPHRRASEPVGGTSGVRLDRTEFWTPSVGMRAAGGSALHCGGHGDSLRYFKRLFD